MNKWTNPAKKRRAVIDAASVKAADLEIIVSALRELPPGQLKKVFTDPVLAVLEKYQVTADE